MVLHINPKFKFCKEEFEDNLELKLGSELSYDYIVPARDIINIKNISLIHQDNLYKILREVKIKGTDHKPYKNSCFDIYRIAPRGIKIGQTFILKEKIYELHQFSNFAEKFSIGGFSKMPPLLIYGENDYQERCCAIYVPPIVEEHSDPVLLDGIHRSCETKVADTTQMYLYIKRVDTPLPFKPNGWDMMKYVDERPPINERYIDLDISLFRDLSVVGIDG